MKSRFVRIVAVSSLLLLSSAAAQAQSLPMRFGVGAGLNVPVSNVKDALDTGFRGQAMVKMSIPAMPIAVRYTVGFERMNLKETVFPMGGNTSIFSGVADAMYGIPAGPVKLYALAGLGAFNARTNVSGFPGVSQTRFGLDGGAGVEFPVGMMSGFAEVRLQNIFTDSKTSTALGGNKEFPTRTIPISVGFYF